MRKARSRSINDADLNSSSPRNSAFRFLVSLEHPDYVPADAHFANLSTQLTIQHVEAVQRLQEASISRWPRERGSCRRRTGLFLTARRLLERAATPLAGADGDASARSLAAAANARKAVDSLGAHDGLPASATLRGTSIRPTSPPPYLPARRRRRPRRSTVSRIDSTAPLRGS